MVVESAHNVTLDDATLSWTDARLLGVDEGPPAHGTVVDRGVGVVSVRVPAGIARLLDGSRVWVNATSTAGQALLLRALAERAADARDVLHLRDLVHLATETRRRHVRSAVEHAVLLVQHGSRTRRTVTRDLSVNGCRVEQLPEVTLKAGQLLQVAISMGSGPVMWAQTEVKRVDKTSSEVALQFLDVDGADRDRLDRYVLSQLTAGAA
jgi:hypothetical protein